MSAINYSKWDHIEISDDEDDTHPNIDTPSLFRWRHQARLQKMEEREHEHKELEEQLKKLTLQMEECKKKIASGDDSVKEQLSKLEIKDKELRDKQDAMNKKDKMTPWNIDTICKEGKTRTIINKDKPKQEQPKTEEETWQTLKEFKEKYDKQIKQFGLFTKHEDAQKFLEQHPHLVCEQACDHLVLWCIDLAVEQKEELLKYVTKQCITLQFLLRLGQELGTDPRNCLVKFYAKLNENQPDYMHAFNEELDAFRERIKVRAQARIDEAVKEYEEEERQKRLGPGGLDPVEVFESLPEPLQKCFEDKDIPRLQQILLEMPEDDARYHMKRCVDSGMWVPEKPGSLLTDEPSAEEVDEDDGEYASAAELPPPNPADVD